MRELRGWMVRLAGLFNKAREDRELDAEIKGHLQMHVEDNLRLGLSPQEARRQAMIKLGGIESTKEACRDQRGLPWIDALLQDLRYGSRMLRKNAGFAGIAMATLALGIGANTTVFSVARAVLFRPLSFETPDRLMWIQVANPQTGASNDRLSWRDVEDIGGSTQSFESLAIFAAPGATWEQRDRVVQLPALSVTPSLAEVLRIRPELGRMFLAADVAESADQVVLISHELWQTRFGGRPDIIGQTLRLNEKTHTVVGVLPPGLRFPLERAPSGGTGSSMKAGLQSFWFPMRVDGPDRVSRDARMFHVIGRLKPNVSQEAARAQLSALGQLLANEHPETNRRWSFELVSFRDQVLGRTRQGIPILAAAVAAVLLICCINLANLLLARAAWRQRELAVRLALGAGRGRLVQALMVESILLSMFGGALGIVLAVGALHGVRVLATANVPFIGEATVDGATLVFTGGLSLLTAFMFGLLPALRQSRVEAAESLRSGARSTAGPRIRAWQQSLLVGQISIVLVLLVSAGLLLESFRRLIRQDLGYKPQSVIALDLSTWGFTSNEETCQLYRTLHARLAALSGVEAVGTISSAPLTGKWTFDEKVQVVGQPVPEGERPSLAATFVAFDYFPAMGIPLLDGRFFRDDELKDNGYGQIVIINKTAAEMLFPGRSAVGGRFTVGSNPDRVLEVVGVVKDTRDVRLEEKPQPRFYWQYAFGGAQVVIRSLVPSRALMPLLRDIVQQTDRRIISIEIKPMTEIVTGTLAERRFLMAMLAAYAAVALGIAAVGIFGVVAYQVAQRSNEFGIRLALGATPQRLVGLVLTQAGRLITVGLAIGLLLSLGTTRLIASQLFGLSPHDSFLLGGMSILLLAVALVASFVPARRAAKVDPMVALRYE